MSVLKLFIFRIPFWAYLPVLVVMIVHSGNMYNLNRMPVSGEVESVKNGHYIIDYVKPGCPVDKAGIKVGDTIVSCNSYSLEEWTSSEHGQWAGDTLIFGMIRNNLEVGIPVILTSRLDMNPGLFWPVFIIMILVSIGSLYMLYKKPYDKVTKLFFLYIQQFAVMAIGAYWVTEEAFAIFIAMAFQFSYHMVGPTLIHFHLLFPEPIKKIYRFKRLPLLFYIPGLILFLVQPLGMMYPEFITSFKNLLPIPYDYIPLWWTTITFSIAMAIAISQFITSKDTLTRNQLRIVVIGTFFGYISPLCYTFFGGYMIELNDKYPSLLQIVSGTGSLIMTCCILVAIFRYRIWDIEIFIKKALLYLGATFIIILSYSLMIHLVDRITISETSTTRFISLAVSVIIFLVLRDRLQHLIDRIFHRETYDSATVVSDFEGNLAGTYRVEELKEKIVQGLEEIFHFKSLVFNLKKHELRYETIAVYGMNDHTIITEYEITPEFEEKLRKSKVFSLQELNTKPAFLDKLSGELIVPMLSDGQPNGFFICGQKKSERIYSRQDINVLTLLARRVIALLHTASLYQRDLDRQLLLEQERARISQDMHDDIGAGLTKIAMISEAPARSVNQGAETSERMARVASSARDIISRLNVIIWALNPKNDNLDGLVVYIRRYFGEYLENFDIQFRSEVPETLPELSLSPDTRRNIFYAVQEAIHNAVKHADCSEVHFDLKINLHELMITITDNGKGFNTSKVSGSGNGLLNMKKRAEELGGSLDIQSSLGRGTKVKFTSNLQKNV